ncbi:MAG TPA: hypothetical protein VIU46_03765 [Gallionellaceae bacterium]
MSTDRLMTFAVAACMVLAGCAAPKSYVDPATPKVSYEDVKKRAEPLKLNLVAEFQRNGEHLPKVDATLRNDAEKVLRSSGVIVATQDMPAGEIKIVVNNIADLAAARAKGFATGLTLGLAGSTVTDDYEMTISITVNGKTIKRSAIRHSLHTIVGSGSAPEGVEVVTPNVGFERVLEQMILRALHDMQSTGELVRSNVPTSVPWEALAAQG